MYVAGGRDSVLPERVLKASLLMRSIRFGAKAVFCEQCATTCFSV